MTTSSLIIRIAIFLAVHAGVLGALAYHWQ
jgi:hypothetical protein